MPGFRHSHLDDIQRIRQDLRDRYQDGFPILKELLQNADDAGATEPGGAASQLVLVLAKNGLPGASHPLLQTAGLAVLNDGAFTASDAISITSLGMSNKAGQAGAAGKFGLGLKSIFHWAEAFFYFSPHEFTEAGPNQASPCDLLNPWWSREAGDGRHRDWEDAWSTSRSSDLNAFTQLAQQALDGGRWFGLWIPLRQQGHLRDGSGEIKPIEQSFPEAELEGLLGQDWQPRLVETLPLLRRLRCLRVCSWDASSLAELGRFEVEDEAQRIRFGLNGVPNVAPLPQPLSGAISSGQRRARACSFSGLEQTNGLPLLEELKQHHTWPSQTAIGPDGGDLQVAEKAEPHGAVVLTRQSANGKGSLRLQHAVFLPLGEPEEVSCGGSWRYGLYLHGFFFVDSGRRHIQPFDDLPEDFTPGQADTELKVVMLWNRTLLCEVVAPLVLPGLDTFVKEAEATADEVELLVGALQKSKTLKPLLPWMCRGQHFVYRLQSNGGAWERETWQAEGGQPRRWIGLPELKFAEHELLDLLPALGCLCSQATVSFDGKPSLADGKPAHPDDSELAALLEGVQVVSFDNAAHLEYLLKLIPEDAADRKADSDLVKALVRLANQLLAQPLPDDKELARKWKEFFSRLPAAALVRLPVKSSEADPAIKQALCGHAPPVALLWEDWREAKGDGKIPWADLVPVLQGLGGVDLRDERAIQRRSEVAVRLLEACPDQPPAWPDHIARLPLFACRGAGAQTTAASRAELQHARDADRLFTSGESWAKDLAKAAPDLKPVLVEGNVAKVLGLPETACDAAACVRLLCSANRLADDSDNRKPIFDRLLGQANLADNDGRQALRCLLHGQLAEWKCDAALFCEPPQTDAFLKLAKLALQAANQSWRLLPHSIAGQLRLDDQQRQKLNLLDVSASTVEALVQEIRPSNVDCTNLTTEECDNILLQFNDTEVLRGLNIHEALDGRRVRIEGHTYVDDGLFTELPAAFDQLVSRIRPRTGYGRFQHPDGSNRLVNKLSWEAVIEIALSQPQPAAWWETILTAIGRLGTLRTEVRDRVREIAWLPLAAGSAIKPADLLHIAGAETELDHLSPEVLNGKVPILRLAEAVRKHERFDTFTRTVLPQAKESLELLASLLKPHPDWSTGLTGDWSAEQVADWVAALGDAPAEVLPVAGLVKAIHGQMQSQELLPGFLQSIGGQLGETAYAGVLKHLATKHQQADQDQRRKLDAVFAHYLRAVDALGAEFAKRVLRTDGVTLRSTAGHWRPPAELTWPTHGVVPDDQLCREHADALASLQEHHEAGANALVNAVDNEPFDQAFDQTANRLRQYFAPWTEYVPREVIGAFLSVLGDGHGRQVRTLAEEFLGQNSVDGIREAIAGAATQQVEVPIQQALAYHEFACVLHQEQLWQGQSILGSALAIRLGGDHETIFLGSSIRAFPCAGTLTEAKRWLHLLCFDPAEAGADIERLQGLLRASAEQILASVFCQTGINLQPLWQRWGQPAQLHIRIAQNRVVEAAQAFLRQVGAHHAPAIKEVLRAWDAADRRRAEAEENNRPVPTEVQEALSAAKTQLRQLLAENPEAQNTALAAVRGKMEQYQYDPKSVPFELWQNADDAAVELEVLGYDNEPVRALGCVAVAGAGCFDFIHWGRLINEFQGAKGRSFRERGFDQDLEKMVVQSVSDKAPDGAASTVTGKFGLGFKSVFLVSDAPEVVSGSLDFVIRGGIYPVRLDTPQRDALVAELKQLAPDHWRRGTLIRLPLRADGKPGAEEVLSLFLRLAPLLVVFARRLRRLRLHQEGQPGREIHWQPEPLADGIEAGAVADLDDHVSRALVFSGAAGNDRMQFLLGLGPDGFVPLPKDVPTFWVTAPTRATPDYGFAVNGPFEPDVGRVQLAAKSKRNEELADELARVLAERLNAVWELAHQDWQTVRTRLGLGSGTALLRLGESLWEVLGQRFAEKCLKSDSSQPAALARRILWQSQNVGLRRFYADCSALPTGLWGEHQVLTKLGDLRFVAAGVLDREDLFRAASQWPAFQSKVQPGQAVSESRVVAVLRRLDALPEQLETAHLATVVQWELKQDVELRADPEAAARLGQLVTPEFLKALREGKPVEREEREHEALSKLLPSVLFQAADDSWHQPAELVVADGEGVDDDEKMRAAFAPPEARLHPAYTGPALAFFLACRPRLEADAANLARWILQAPNDSCRTAALTYLLNGKLKETVAEELRSQKDDNSWLWQLAFRPENFGWFDRNFSKEDLHQIRAYVLRIYDGELRERSVPPPPPPPPPPLPVWTVRQLWLWWEDQGKPMGDYVLEGAVNWPLFHGGPIREEVARKAELKRLLLNPDSPEGKQLWYRLFGYACLVSAGRKVIELRDFWLGRLEPAGFWTRTSAGDFSDQTREIFERAVTAEFNNLSAGGELAYFWRRVFYDIRKVHRMVQNDFPAVLLDLVHQGHGEHLRQFLRTGHLPGPEQPRWIGTFGQSADTPLAFIIQELFRLGVISDEAVRPHAFYVCRPVLRALAKIGWIGDSDDDGFSGEQWLEMLAKDPEYGQKLQPYFDIPLLHLGITHRGKKMPELPPEP